MSVSPQEALESSYKVIKLKKLEQFLYALQIIAIIIVGVVCLHYNGASLKPLYLPIAPLLFLFVFTLFLIFIESLFFRVLKMKYSETSSTKYIIARNAGKEAVAVIIVSAIIGGILFSPPLANYFEEGLQKAGTQQLSPGTNITVHFQFQGHLGLTKVTSVSVNVSLGSVDVYILLKEKFETGNFNQNDAFNRHPPSKVHLENETMIWTPSASIEGYTELVLYIANATGISPIVRYNIEVEVSNTITIYMPGLAVCIIIASIVWIIYFRRIKMRLRAESIYK